jgi:uncharacterized protein YndB with AHSA1/START domain
VTATIGARTNREFELVRIFDGSRDLVFKVWTDPKYVALWWGVDGATNSRCELDVRPGGAWRIDMRTANGAVFPNGGFFLEVVTNERLVYSDIADPDSIAWAGTLRGPLVHTVTFEDAEGGGTKVSLVVRADSQSDRDRLVELGMRDGVAQGLNRLQRLLDELVRDADGSTTRPVPR